MLSSATEISDEEVLAVDRGRPLNDAAGSALTNRWILQDKKLPTIMAQCVKPLLIGHSAHWAKGLRARTSLGSNLGLEGFFSSIRLAGML